LIRVIAKISPRFPALKLLLIGDGPEKDRLLQRASQLMPLGSYIFTGLVPDAYRLLKGIDILCSSSLTEGMPNVILEAHAAGIPVVANKVGAIPSLVKDGVNGFVVEAGAEAKFLDAVEKLVSNIGLRSKWNIRPAVCAGGIWFKRWQTICCLQRILC
jgi:glycosyltransferase involved in cell wall biosynthesis